MVTTFCHTWVWKKPPDPFPTRWSSGSPQSAGTYLFSWSPAQGYEVSNVIRGPAATTKVTFTSSHKLVTMAITCPSGEPSTSTTVTNWGDE